MPPNLLISSFVCHASEPAPRGDDFAPSCPVSRRFAVPSLVLSLRSSFSVMHASPAAHTLFSRPQQRQPEWFRSGEGVCVCRAFRHETPIFNR